MNFHMYFRRDGKPYLGPRAGLMWARDFHNPEYQIVKQEELPNGLWVSTVWMGINHALFRKCRPLIFETMVFQGKGGNPLDCWRYAKEDEAILGHKMVVKKYSAFKTAEDVLKEKRNVNHDQ